MTAARKKFVGAADVTTIVRELWSEHTAESPIVQNLRHQMANTFVLYTNYQHYHWQTYGPLFRDLHRLFDELAKEVLGCLDQLAERVQMVGQDPPAHPIQAMGFASVSAAAPHSTVHEMLEEADRQLLVVIKEMREASRAALEHGDPGTADFFSRIVQTYEKHEWWLRDVLRRGDGLIT